MEPSAILTARHILRQPTPGDLEAVEHGIGLVYALDTRGS